MTPQAIVSYRTQEVAIRGRSNSFLLREFTDVTFPDGVVVSLRGRFVKAWAKRKAETWRANLPLMEAEK